MNAQRKNIAILGSTGSIGKQALEVIAAHPDRFHAEVLTANTNSSLLIRQAMEFRPSHVVIASNRHYHQVSETLIPLGINVFTGFESLAEVAGLESVDIVLTAMVGFSGLGPTIRAIETGKTLALANKETLVVAGDYITALARKNKVNIYPVDSEHSAIFQCIAGESLHSVEKIFLTASGGPFRGKLRHELAHVTKELALKHPNWNMGAKITVDSATLMNKGFEVIEARWLFGLRADHIEVVVHPQSIIHSMVEFSDGSIKAQLSIPDMRLPIQYAFSYPERLSAVIPRLNFNKIINFTFEKPDTVTFRNLSLAYAALEKCGNMPCVLNAANEVAVDAFLHDRLGFLQIPDVIETCLDKIPYISIPAVEDYAATDHETRIKANEIIG